MTNTKWLAALLAGGALAATAAAAQADDLSNLKAQLEALQTQVASMQATPAPSAIRTTYTPGEGVTFAIAPTADAAAPTTEVTVKGEVRTRAISTKVEGKDSTSDFDHRARVTVTGKTASSVGEVGALVRLNQSNVGTVDANTAYGWWQVTPELQLLAGRTDSIGSVEAGIDWNFNGSLVGNVGGPTDSSADQLRLTYASGPFSVGLSAQDGTPGTGSASGDGNYGVGAAVKLNAAEGVDFSIAGVSVQDNTTGANAGKNGDYFVGAGANIGLGSMASATVAAGTGEGPGAGANYGTVSNDEGFTNASVGLTLNVSDSTSVELGYGYTNPDDQKTTSDVTAALLWSPAGQLTIGAGVGRESSPGKTDTTTAGVGAWFKF